MIELKDAIERGTIYTLCNFLDVYDELNARKENYEYEETYQPVVYSYGSRFHAYPCYETELLELVDAEMNNIIRSKVQKLFSQRIIDWQCRVRLSLSSEMKESGAFKDGNYGFVHTDKPHNFAGVLPFDQSPTGGTAFFEYHWDKVPDITHGTYPNRLILYSGKRWHAAGQDFNIEKRYVIPMFFNLA